MVQNRIEKIKQYFRSIELVENTIIIRVKYLNKWGVYPSEDNLIKVTKSDDAKNEWYYYADSDKKNISEIFDLIDETIEMNISAAKKIALLDKKFAELKTIFSNESLDRLETLKFVMKPNKKAKVKKSSKNETQLITTPTLGQNEDENNILNENIESK